jgi:hypothetical protein
MKSDQYDRLEQRGCLDHPRKCDLETLQPPEIVGQVENPVLEAIRRLWWRAFDCVCYWTVLARLSIFECILGAEPPRPADHNREADDRLDKYPAAKI